MYQNTPIKCPIEHKVLPQKGYSIHYFLAGPKEGKTILFLHPAFVDHRAFNNQIDYFTSNYRVITIDLLGHGLSQIDKAKDKLDATTLHIDAILKLEAVDKVHLVGVSMGSLLAQYFALNYPQKVLSLTVVGGYDINSDVTEIQKEQRKEMLGWIFKAIFSMNSLRRYVASVSVSEPKEQENFYEMAHYFKRKSFMAMSGLDAVVKIRSNIKRSYPLMIICGRKDRKIALEAAKRWHNSDPSTEFFVIISAGHCANMDKPEEFNMILESFIC